MPLASGVKLFLAFLFGVLLGAILFHTPPAKAQERLASLLTIQRVHIVDPRVNTSFKAGGPYVVGFSCAQKDGQADCYVASASAK